MRPMFHVVGLSLLAGSFALAGQTAEAQDLGRAAKPEQVEKLLQNWKQKPRMVAQEMIEKYGQPQEATAQRLVWHNNGPWKRTELLNEEIDHQFPLPHKDMLLQVVDYKVPADKFDDIAEYDGSVILERTRGEMAARCDKEAANILALNLAQEIATGKRSAEDAKKVYAEQIIAMASGQPAPLTKKLNFKGQANAGDPGRQTIDEETAQRVKQQMKQMEKKKD